MSDPTGGTKERILAAAAEVFGAKGYRSATIRQIAETAGVNLAAINYHFKGKLALYTEVVDAILAEGFTHFPADMGLPAGRPATERLEAFVRSFCHRLLSPEGWGGYHGKARLFVREMADPSPVGLEMVTRHIEPHKRMLVDIVQELLGPGVAPSIAVACAFSIVGQCMYYATALPMLVRLAPDQSDIERRIDELADHVLIFSLGGIDKLIDSRSVRPTTEGKA